MPLRQWLRSSNYAIEGILHAAKTQRHLRYHFYAASVVLVTSYVLGITKTEFLIIALAVIAVLVAEMVNTAFEAMVDLLSPEHAPQARAAKDIAAGAVLITAFGAVLIGYIVLFPYVSEVVAEGPYLTKHPKEEVAVIAFVLILILVILLKAYFGTGHPLSGGMPSGHSALAFSVWMSITLTSGNVLVSLLCFLLATAIAQSRVTTKTHKPWEVILGGLLGAAITFVLFQVFS
jgi:diacylglycerol kinase (ATP)